MKKKVIKQIEEKLVLIDKKRAMQTWRKDRTEKHEKDAKQKRMNQAKAELNMIKGQYAILIADKANNTYVIHCKKHLAEQVLKEITRNLHQRKGTGSQ